MAERRIRVWVQEFSDREFLQLQWHCPATGKRKTRSAGTADPAEAEHKRADLEYELNNGLHREPSRLAWPDFRRAFEAEYLSGCRPATRDNYRVTLDLFEELCSPGRLAGVTARTVSAFAAGMRDLPRPRRNGATSYKASSIAVRLECLHTALAWAARQGLLTACPPFPRVDVPARAPQPVPAEAFERLLARAGDDMDLRGLLLSCWLAGLRRNEAVYLEWAQTDKAPWIDLGRDRILFPAEFVKAGRDQWVPLDPDLREALERLPRAGRRVFRLVHPDGRPLTPVRVSQRVARLAAAAGVRLTLRALRRGFGCRYAGRVPAQVLQRLMRHANIKTTMEFYANIDCAVEEAVLGNRRNTSRDILA